MRMNQSKELATLPIAPVSWNRSPNDISFLK